MKTKYIIICSVFLMLFNVPNSMQAKKMVSRKVLQLFRYGYTGQEKELELKHKKEI